MSFEPKMRLTQGLRQQLVITPQLKHAIKILQLSRADLEQLVTEEMEQNPTLEELSVGQEEMEMDRETETPDDRMGEVVDPTQMESEAPAREESGEVDGETGMADVNWDEYLSELSLIHI